MDINATFYGKLRNLIAECVLKLAGGEIDQLYNYWLSNIDKQGIKNLHFPDSEIHPNQQIPVNAILKGVDLPSWFGNLNHPRIVVLGIDPLRDRKDFVETDNLDASKNVIIGTPYAFHEKVVREGHCKSYWTLVDGLVKAGRFVYCTDIFKTYYYNTELKVRSYLDSNFTKNNVHRELLINELNLIQPDYVIVFGKLAHSILFQSPCPKLSQAINITKKQLIFPGKIADVYTVLHLSKTPRGEAFKRFFFENGLNQITINYENRQQCAELYLQLLRHQNVC